MRTERNATLRTKTDDADKLLREVLWEIVDELEKLNENVRMISKQLADDIEKL